MSVYRPGGVTVIAIVFIIFGVLGIIAGVALVAMGVFMTQNAMVTFFVQSYLINLYSMGTFPPELANLYSNFIYATMIIEVINTQSAINTLPWIAVSALISSAVFFIASYGLLSMRKWGYYLAIILGVLTIFSIIGLVIVIYLLMSEAKYEFD